MIVHLQYRPFLELESTIIHSLIPSTNPSFIRHSIYIPPILSFSFAIN